jgi:hypothetical protein
MAASTPVALWAAVVLLAACTVLLWQLVDTRRITRTTAGAAPALSAPSLPAPKATSADAMLQQLGVLQRRLEKPLTGIGANLSAALNQLAFTGTLPSLLRQLVGNTAGFPSVPGNLTRLTAAGEQLAKLPHTLVGLLRELHGLNRAASSIGPMAVAVEAIRSSFNQATGSIRALLTTTDQTLPQMITLMRGMAAAMAQMASDVAAIKRCTQRPVVCSGG